MKSVKKALIPAAGWGTRFLPITKTVPKELLPIVDSPIILYVIEEALRANIEEIVLVIRRDKSVIEDFFQPNPQLVDHLERTHQHKTLERLKKIESQCHIIPVQQEKPLGLGHAVYCGHSVMGKEPFAVLLGDEIMWNPPQEESVIQQLVQHSCKVQMSTTAVIKVEKSEVSKYGIIVSETIDNQRYKVLSVVEKPSVKEAPSQLALPGRYIFDAKIFHYLRDTKPRKNGEIQLTDGMTSLARVEGMEAIEFQGQRFDAGDQLGYLKANVELGLKHPGLGKDFKRYLIQLVRGFHET